MSKIILQNFMFSSRFMLFPTFKKKKWCKKIIRGGGGGGGVEIFFFFKKNNSFSFYALCYCQH